MNAIRVATALIALVMCCGTSSCLKVRHYVDNAESMDGLFFGPARGEPLREDSNWRIYNLWGLYQWDRDDIDWVGRQLADSRSDAAKVVVETRFSVLNGLAYTGVWLFVGLLTPALFYPQMSYVQFRAAD